MAGRLDVVAIIPMKPLAAGKSRLRWVLTPEERADITIGMLRRVIMAVQGASIDPIWIIGGDERVRNVARNFSSLWMPDFGRNLNDTLSKAFQRAFQQGKSALYLPGDLPFIKASDIHGLVGASRRLNNITLAPARRDGGTNGILVPLGLAFQPELGRRSFSKHLSQAARLGISVAICYTPGLGFDLDTLDDLETYQHLEPGLLQRLSPTADSKPSVPTARD
jgi:2-phospho-L-lactate guanylyltransferase